MKTAKRLLAMVLSLLLALPLSMMGLVLAEGETTTATSTESPYKVLATVAERISANKHSSGYQAANNGMKINLLGMDSTITYDDLALHLNVYIENRDNAEDCTLFEDSQGQFQFVSSIEQVDGKYVYYQVCWNWNKLNKFDLKPGWNTLQLNFSTEAKETGIAADTCNIDLTNVNNFRWAFWNITDFENYDNYRIRIGTAEIVDTRYPAEAEPTYSDTDAVEGTWPTLDGATTYTTTGGPGGLLNTGIHSTTPINVTGHDPEKLYLSLEMYAGNKTNPENVASAFAGGQIRLFSTGVNDKYAHFYSRTSYASFQPNEWNTLLIPWTQLQNPGNIDQTAIEKIYIYFDSVNNGQYAGDTLELMVKNVQIVDLTNAPVEMELPTLFGDGMIFQQNKPISIWGTAEAGDTVNATLKKGDEPVDTPDEVTVDENGNWEIQFDGLPGSYDTYSIVIENRGPNGEVRTTKTLHDIVIGEVWVAGGQSNMALSVGTDAYATEILNGATNHNIRVYIEPGNPVGDGNDQPLDPLFSVPGAYWAAGDNKNAMSTVSSVGYNFIVKMQEELDMPVGLLNTALGGSLIEAWISREAVDGDETYKTFLDDNDKYCDEYWWPTNANRQSALYNAKIGPLEGYNVAGAIWYQGESNSANPEIYDTALALLQKDWSETFGFGEERMPFIVAQLAPHYYNATNGMSSSTYMGYMAESISRAWAANSETMSQISIYDLPLVHIREDGNSADPIHPNDKRPVAARMATAALNMVYGGDGETTSPVYKSMEVKGDAIYVDFDHVGDGLMIGNESANLQGFAIAGADGVFVNAQAVIVDADTVKVWNDKVVNPKNMTYAFTSFNMAGNLVSSDDFAVVPFRTTTETEDAKLFHANDWIYADGEVWVSVNSTLPREEQAAFHDLWTATDAEHSYDATVKSEGKASLKVAYTGTSTTIAPNPADYRSQSEAQFANFGGLTVDMKNDDDRAKEMKLAVVSGGKTYTSTDVATLAANSDFTGYDFSLTDLVDEAGVAVADAAAVLANATTLQFVVTDTAAGTVYLDNIRFAVDMDAQIATVLYGDTNLNGEVTAEDALMALQAATGKVALTADQITVANVDGKDNVEANDALNILQYVTKKIASFPVEG